MSYVLKITVFNNRDYTASFTLNDSDGQPLNLAGKKLLFAIGTPKPVTYDSSVVSNKVIFVDNAATGQIRLELPYSILKTIAPATYNHELLLVKADGDREGIWSGTIIVKKGLAA